MSDTSLHPILSLLPDIAQHWSNYRIWWGGVPLSNEFVFRNFWEYPIKSSLVYICVKDSICDIFNHALANLGADIITPVSSVRDLRIYLDSDLSMRTHISKTVSACFAVLRLIRSIRRSVTRPVLQSMVASLVLTRLDYGCSTLASLPARQLNRLQSVINSAARLVYSARRSEHMSPLLRELHWLRVPKRIDFRLAVLVYRCMNGTAPRYLGSELQRVADIESRRCLWSASSPSLHVPRSLHRTIGDRAFPVAAAKIWKALPPSITSLPSLKRALKTELFRRSYGNTNYRPQQHWH